MLKNTYLKFLSKINRFKFSVNSVNLNDFDLKINSYELEFKEPVFFNMNPSYVLIKNMQINPEITIKTLQKFENMIKWLSVNMNFTMIFRNYPLKIVSTVKHITKEALVLKLVDKIKSFEPKQINIAKKIKITDEIVQIRPYTRLIKKQKLFKLPIARSPLYKSYFSSEQLKKFREEIAAQNNTRWSNIEVLEIYDKFNGKLFSDIKQTSGSRNLLCYPNISNADMKINNDFYYLIIGKRRDTGELVKALSNPIIKEDDSNIQ